MRRMSNVCCPQVAFYCVMTTNLTGSKRVIIDNNKYVVSATKFREITITGSSLSRRVEGYERKRPN